MKNAIEVEGLKKYYGRILAVDGISFSVGHGRIFGLLGPNGAGKSTTIRVLTGLTRPSGGAATVLGLDVVRETVKMKGRIGVVPELSNVYDEMTALDNLVFSGELYGVPKNERKSRARGLLGLFGLSDRAADPAGTFSRGLKRRLTIACALVHEPELLFLDEPTTGLDVQSAHLVRELIRGLNKDGVTILLTTHYIAEADQLCDQIAILNHGKIVALDSPGGLKAGTEGTMVVEVSFDGVIPEAEAGLLEIVGVDEAHKFGDKYRLVAEGSSDIVAELVGYARSRGLTITSINTVKPSLEEAFIKITGLDTESMKVEKDQVKPGGGEGGKRLG